jgi:histidinol dehydrogenase
MRFTRFDWDGAAPRKLAREIRALQPQLEEVAPAVAEVVAEVGAGGDAAVLRCERRFGGVEPATLRVPEEELRAAPEAIPGKVVGALRRVVENVRGVASAGRPAPTSSGPRLGIEWSFGTVAVESAGAYVPGGAGAYPSTAVMCCVPAQVAGVQRIAVASPPGPDGRVSPLVLAAASLSGATHVYATGGAQAIAALALGTESVRPVDVIVGPGNRYVQEAKRQLVGKVGIDGIAGPSELMVVADGSAELRHLALDLCAQVEHGGDGLLVACAADEAVLADLRTQVEAVASSRETVHDAGFALVLAPSSGAAVELADALAPEHLELATVDAEELAREVRYAGCVFVGPYSATAFGDYAAGSNHVLPTGGAGRYTGPLSPTTFRREITRLRLSREAAGELAPVVATLADAEGFPVHGESALARAKDEKGAE